MLDVHKPNVLVHTKYNFMFYELMFIFLVSCLFYASNVLFIYMFTTKRCIARVRLYECAYMKGLDGVFRCSEGTSILREPLTTRGLVIRNPTKHPSVFFYIPLSSQSYNESELLMFMAQQAQFYVEATWPFKFCLAQIQKAEPK